MAINAQEQPLSAKQFVEQKRRERQAQRAAITVPEPKKRREGIADNPWDDVVNFGREIRDFFVSVPQFAANFISDPRKYLNEAKRIFEPGVAREVGSVLWRAATETHRNDKGDIDLWESFTQRPAHFIADLFLVKGILTKAARVSRLAKIAKVGEAVSAIERFPAAQIGAGLKRVARIPAVERIRTGLGIGPATKDLLAIRAHELADEARISAERIQRLAYRSLGPADVVALNRAVRVGAPDDLAKLTPAARKWYDEFTDLSTRQEAWLKAQPEGLLSDKRAFAANAKAAALTLYGPNFTRAQRAEVVKLMLEGKIKPTFASLYKISDSNWRLFSTLGQDVNALTGKVGRLEARYARGLFDEDIVTTAIKQTKAFHQLVGKRRFLARTMEYLQSKGLVRAIKHEKDLRPGEAILPSEVFKKYMETQIRAVSAYWRQKAAGAATRDAVVKAFEEVIGDPALRRELREIKHIAVPEYVANFIRQELAIPSPMGQVYDRLIGYWKGMATVLRPSYWTSVAAGNGILMAVHGVGPDDVARASAIREFLPPTVRSRLQHELAMPGTNLYERVAGTLGEASTFLDRTMLRGPVFAKEAERTRRALMEASSSTFAASDILSDPTKFAQMVAASPAVLSSQARIVERIYERVAQTTPELLRTRRELVNTAKKIASEERRLEKGLEAAATPQQRAALTFRDEKLMALRTQARELETKLARDSESIVRKLQRAARIDARLPETRQIAAWADDAIIAGNRLTGDIWRMLPAERKYLRRLIPFYAFSKAMTMFVAKLPFVYPGKVFLWNRWAYIVNDMREDPEFPDKYRSYAAIGHTADGSTVYVRIASLIPWQASIRGGLLGEIPIPSLLDIPGQNPLIKLLLELKGGPTWSERPWSPGEKMTRLDNGEVYEYRNGRLRRTIAQPSMWRSIWYMFPAGQMIDEILFPYMMTDRGWLLNPDPIRRPDGQIMYPRELLDRLASVFLLRTMARKEEDIRLQTRRRWAAVMRSYREDFRRASPEEREAIREVYQDALEFPFRVD